MQKKYADFKLGVPDYVTVETEEERLVCCFPRRFDGLNNNLY